jgi:hypothetical protein
LRPGELLGDRFEIQAVAGGGGMGAIYRAVDRRTAAQVAIKVVRDGADVNSRRFAREAQIIAGLEHPRIVRHIDHGFTGSGQQYLVMEWLEGEDLSVTLKRRSLELSESVELTARICEALAVLHKRGLVHRDVKPSNIFLCRGAIEDVKLLDFGIARFESSAKPVTNTGMIIGTPGYMAPEQARGDRDVGGTADIFSLGCVLFECLTGRAPFVGAQPLALLAKILLEEAPHPIELRPELPRELDTLVSRMMAKDPAARPSDATAVSVELRQSWHEGVRVVGPAPSGDVLTGGELKLLCVLVASIPSASVEDEATPTMTMTGGETAPFAKARGAAAPLGVEVAQLADGSLVATLHGEGAAHDQAARAARCALAWRSLLDGGAIALATGRGRVDGRLPFGEVVEGAAAMLAKGTAGAIRIDALTAGLLDERFEVVTDAAGARTLHGEREAVEDVRTLLGRPSPCVGRERELGILRAIYDDCASESAPRAALVIADAGVGKSRLRHEMLRALRAAEEPPTVWLARADQVGAGSPFGLLTRLLRHGLGIVEGAPPDEQRRLLRERVTRNLASGDAQRVSEFIGEIIGVRFPDEESLWLRAARKDAQLMGDQLRRAFLELVAAESKNAPLVLVLEDLQWGDLPTVQYVDAVLRDLGDRRIFGVALARPEVKRLFPDLWSGRDVTELRLATLSRKAAEKLARSALGEKASAEDVARAVERADGNALFLEELIRAISEGRRELPETVLAMAHARLEQLDPVQRRILRAASVFGETFWRGALRSLLGTDVATNDLDDVLGTLVRAEAVSRRSESRFADEEEFCFRHGLVREAAYAALTEPDRVLGHALAARWLEAAGETEALVLADHWVRGGKPSEAVRWYLRAAEQALEGDDLDAALSRSAQGEECGAEGEALGALRLVRAEATFWKNQLEEAERVGLEAVEQLPRGTSRWYRAIARVAWTAGQRARGAPVKMLAETLAEIDAERRDSSWVIAAARVVRAALGSGALEAATKLFTLLDDLRDASRDPSAEAAVSSAVAYRAWARGDDGVFLDAITRCVAANEACGDLRQASWERGNLTLALCNHGCFEEAEACARQALTEAERFAMPMLSAWAKYGVALPLLRSGRAAESLPWLEGSLKDAVAHGNRRLEAYCRALLARAHFDVGKMEEAERETGVLLGDLDAYPNAEALALTSLVRVQSATGRHGEAAATARRLLASYDAGVETFGEVETRLVAARAFAGVGETSEARAQLDAARLRVEAIASAIGDPARRAAYRERVRENADVLASVGGT